MKSKTRKWINNYSNQTNKGKAIIYYTKRKNVKKNLVDSLINYCCDKNLEIINTYKNETCTKRGAKKILFDMLTFIKPQKDRIHIVCNDFYDIFQDVGDLSILEPLITIGKIIIHILEQNFIIGRDNYNTEMIVRIYFIMLSPLLSCSYYLKRIAKNRKKSIGKS